VPIPVFQVFKERGPLAVLYIDGHIDWRDEVDGERYELRSPMRRASKMPWIEHIIQVGACALGSAQQIDYEAAITSVAHIIRAQHLHASAILQVLDPLPDGGDILVTVDCDALDPSIMSAVLGPVPGGFTYW